MSRYINTDIAADSELSRTAQALMLPLTILSNRNNEINKKQFIDTINWIKDIRTWDKYWEELVDKGFLIQLDKDNWMVSPHECYAEGISHSTLITKWNEVRNATNQFK